MKIRLGFWCQMCPWTAKTEWGFSGALTSLLALLALIVCLPGSYAADKATPPGEPVARQELISVVKDVEKTLGFEPTKNFSTQSNQIAAYYRCYYTGQLELPESYEGLKLKEGSQDGCALNPEKYDIFFYPIEAVASGKSPVTTSLANASVERMLVVVPHEDFHENSELRKLPATITEAASTLIGFLTALEAARQKFGENSAVCRNLSMEPELFLQKAEIVNRYHAKLTHLYAAVQSGEISKSLALARKERLFREMRLECKAISPDPSSFNKCLSANNNAGLTFDMTYTKVYPPIYELYLAHDRDVKTTIDAIKHALAAKPGSGLFQEFRNLNQDPQNPSSP